MAEASNDDIDKAGLGANSSVLDGIRAVSIVAVLATHFLPLYVFGKNINTSVGMFGMSLFFILSGYLVTKQGLRKPSAAEFAKRRLLRIIPAAWLCILVTSILSQSIDAKAALQYLFFVANIPPQSLPHPLDHFWSLCVEMQFYAVVCVILMFKTPRIWFVLPAMLLAVTISKIYLKVDGTSITWFRIDDVFAGASLAIFLNIKKRGANCKQSTINALFYAVFALLMLSSLHEKYVGENFLSYFRPYFAALVVGILITRPVERLAEWLSHPYLKYIASVSYALYIWHLPLAATWLGSGDVFEKYVKRPLLLITLFVIAHISTFYFEKMFNPNGRAYKNKLKGVAA